MQLSDSLKRLSHHAYYSIGGDPVRDELVSILEKTHRIKAKGNPDFFDRHYETFTIDDAREVKSTAGTRPVNDSGQKIFILSMNGITVEAQNALLKLLEEPPIYAHFFLVIPSAHLLLPTVRSRLSFIGDASKGSTSSEKMLAVTKKFLIALKSQRLEEIKLLMDDIAKEKRPKQDAIDLLNALEEAVHAKGVKGNTLPLQAILTAKKYATDRAPSLKMLLEYVALSI